jgi:uncharacterized protein with HEPN domain
VSEREWRFYIDNDTLWSIVQQDVPALLPKLRALNASEPGRTPNAEP